MRFCIIVIISFILIFISSFKKPDKLKNVPYRIEVYVIKEIILNHVPYPCENFENRSDAERFIILDTGRINYIIKEISKAKKLPHFNYVVNTRAKLIMFYKSGKTDIVCMEYLDYIEFNNSIIQLKSNNLIDFIYDLK